ncbi:MAG: iron-sulfur cluster repair di-iron protein [Microscillaceae bacterium]|nr:iron-sulfur cluster repair di-iron protein [Microscillaceae bacterium]
MERLNLKLSELVDKNPQLASVLHFMGIYFYQHSENTLGEICQQRGLDPDLVIRNFNEPDTNLKLSGINLMDYPLELVVEYLKHMHFVFIKERLTYLARLIEQYPDNEAVDLQDLKLIFPHFMQEFIEHAYEEEDTVFSNILILKKILNNPESLKTDSAKLPSLSIQHLAQAHQHHDGEMAEIKEIMDQLTVNAKLDVHARVIVASLRSFMDELKHHAKIENEILFPKALELEKSVLAL